MSSKPSFPQLRLEVCASAPGSDPSETNLPSPGATAGAPDFKLPALHLPAAEQSRGRSPTSTRGNNCAAAAAETPSNNANGADGRTRLSRLTRLHVSTRSFLKSCEQEWEGETALKDRLANIARLGRGSTSNVWKVVDVETLQLVAVKEIKVANREAKALLVRELDALQSQLSPLSGTGRGTGFKGSPHIVAFFGSFLKQEHGDEICIAVEYVRGGSLQRWLDAQQPAPDAWLAHVARQALSALRFLHQRHRIHRDVKPANLLLGKDGGIKLADFGIAVEAHEDGLGGAMAGTRRYMSCERLRAERYSYNSDIWSLGLSLAAVALGGCPVPQGENEFDQLCFSEDAPALVRDKCRAAGRSEQLQSFLLACLEVDPELRTSAAELMSHEFIVSHSGEWSEQAGGYKDVMRALTRRNSCARLRDGLESIDPSDFAQISNSNCRDGCGVTNNVSAPLAPLNDLDDDSDEAYYARCVTEEVISARRERYGPARAGVPLQADLADLAFELNTSEDALRELFSSVKRAADDRDLARKERRRAQNSSGGNGSSRSRTPDAARRGRRPSTASLSVHVSPQSRNSSGGGANGSGNAGDVECNVSRAHCPFVKSLDGISGNGSRRAGDNDTTPRADSDHYSSDDDVADGAATGRALYARSSPPRTRQRSSLSADASLGLMGGRSTSPARSTPGRRSSGSTGCIAALQMAFGNGNTSVNERTPTARGLSPAARGKGGEGKQAGSDGSGSPTYREISPGGELTDGSAFADQEEEEEVESSYFSEAAQTPSPRDEKEFRFGEEMHAEAGDSFSNAAVPDSEKKSSKLEQRYNPGQGQQRRGRQSVKSRRGGGGHRRKDSCSSSGGGSCNCSSSNGSSSSSGAESSVVSCTEEHEISLGLAMRPLLPTPVNNISSKAKTKFAATLNATTNVLGLPRPPSFAQARTKPLAPGVRGTAPPSKVPAPAAATRASAVTSTVTSVAAVKAVTGVALGAEKGAAAPAAAAHVERPALPPLRLPERRRLAEAHHG